MPVEYVKRITREMVRAAPDTLFVFGDNLIRRGYGGQAGSMRGEPNSVGIPTKRMPGLRQNDFFTDADLAIATPPIDEAFARLFTHIEGGGHVVWPADGIGTGLAELQKRAPKIWQLIEENRIALTADWRRS